MYGAHTGPVPAGSPHQVYVPVTVEGRHVVDNAGDVIVTCFTEELAARVAALLNRDAGAVA